MPSIPKPAPVPRLRSRTRRPAPPSPDALGPGARLGALACLIALLLIPSCRAGKDTSLITASGHVEATDVRISSKVPGRLVSFPVQEGDRVKGGQVIGRIDTTDITLALAAAAAERDQARADLDLRLAGYRKEDIAEMEAQVAQAEADLAGARRDLDRLQALLDRGSGTAKSRDDALTRQEIAAARLAGLRQALARLKAGFRPEEIAATRARLSVAEARMDQLRQQLEDATVASPLDGVVTEKLSEEGELLAVGTALLVVTDLDDAWLTVYVAEPELGRIRIGQEATVVTDGGESRTGRITFVATEAEFTPKNVQTRDERVKLVFRVKIGLDNRDGLFKPGMPAEARIRSAGVP